MEEYKYRKDYYRLLWALESRYFPYFVHLGLDRSRVNDFCELMANDLLQRIGLGKEYMLCHVILDEFYEKQFEALVYMEENFKPNNFYDF